MQEEIRPLVSVWMITYNHEKYIGKAIESVLMQRTAFQFELVIGEDCSTDSTSAIIRDYAHRYPNIKARYNKSNMGMRENVIQTLKECTGKYIAMLEGDDYWTDENKLQIQIDYLENNKTVYGCFHDAINVDENSNIIKDNYYSPPQKVFNQKEALTILQSSYATCSLVFRRKVIDNMPTWFLDTANDFTLDLLITKYGALNYLNLNMCAYRIHSGGIWQGKDSITNITGNLKRIETLLNDPELEKHYKIELNEIISSFKRQIAIEYAKRNSLKRFLHGIDWIINSKSYDINNFRILVGLIFMPNTYSICSRFMKRILKKGRP